MNNNSEGFIGCKCNVIHDEVINNVKPNMIDNDTSYRLAEFYKVFGDSTRIKIVHALSMAEMCVCDISTLLDMSQSAISHQLKVLRQSKLVKLRKAGKVVYYSLDDNHIELIINQGLVHINENDR